PMGKQRAVQLDRRGEVAPEGLLDDQAPPAARVGVEARGRQLLADQAEYGGRCSEIEERVAAGFMLRGERLEQLGDGGVSCIVFEAAGNEMQPADEVGPDPGVEVLA